MKTSAHCSKCATLIGTRWLRCHWSDCPTVRTRLPPSTRSSKAKCHGTANTGYTPSSNQYGNKTGNRLFIPANVFRKGFSVPHITKRTHPIHVNFGYSDADSIHIQLPEGYTIKGLSRPADLKSKFGNFHSSVRVNDNEIWIVHNLFMRKGIYAPEEYEAFLDFRKQVAEQYNGKIILKKI